MLIVGRRWRELTGVILLGLSIWHSVKFGVTPTGGFSFEVAKNIVEKSQIAAQSANAAAQSAIAAADLATKIAEKSPTEDTKRNASEAAAKAKVAKDAADMAVRA